MGWTGENGHGVVSKHLKNKEKVILTVSLNKSFAAAGGCIVFLILIWKEWLELWFNIYFFRTIQPPMLGGFASAKLIF